MKKIKDVLRMHLLGGVSSRRELARGGLRQERRVLDDPPGFSDGVSRHASPPTGSANHVGKQGQEFAIARYRLRCAGARLQVLDEHRNARPSMMAVVYGRAESFGPRLALQHFGAKQWLTEAAKST